MKLGIFATLAVLYVSFPGVLGAEEAKKRAPPTKLQIGVKFKPEGCTLKAKPGDTVAVHYEGTLFDGGKKFDSSYDRGTPIEFPLGKGYVIKGWDQGIAGMCIGEKRVLKIPADLAYGKNGSPPVIPPNAALVFKTELVSINGKKAEKAENKEGEAKDAKRDEL
ncbi:hypothetical protein GGI12_002049 [Dipsacomyces acuminosporus]|nr:hypothetical protein GGI12_002049 [Dipsacomyces acuminosporus]